MWQGRARPCIPPNKRRTDHIQISKKKIQLFSGNFTNGTPEKFQKMTMKPHLFTLIRTRKGFKNNFLLLVEHIPSLRNTFFSFSTVDNNKRDFLRLTPSNDKRTMR